MQVIVKTVSGANIRHAAGATEHALMFKHSKKDRKAVYRQTP